MKTCTFNGHMISGNSLEEFQDSAKKCGISASFIIETVWSMMQYESLSSCSVRFMQHPYTFIFQTP